MDAVFVFMTLFGTFYLSSNIFRLIQKSIESDNKFDYVDLLQIIIITLFTTKWIIEHG